MLYVKLKLCNFS